MKLYRGINLGGFLSQCVHTHEHYESFIGPEDIKIIKDAGFDHVRIPVDYNVLETEDGETIEYGFELVEKVLGWCKEQGLEAVVDLHKAYGYDFNDANDSTKNVLFFDKNVQDRFVNLWIKIATRFGNRENVAFELLNEVVENEATEPWNQLIKRTVAEIRKVTPLTYIIYGGIMWSNISTMKYLEAPADEFTIFTFHCYEPLLFTHQRASWIATMDKERTMPYPAPMSLYKENAADAGVQGDAVLDKSNEMMDIVYLRKFIEDGIAEIRQRGIKLYCGEFGVIDQAPPEYAANWYRDIAQIFKDNKIGCAVWSYKKMDFGIFGDDSPFKNERDMILSALLD